MKPVVTIIDYGVGNLLSVKNAFEYCGNRVEFTDSLEGIRASERLVLPGVGAFKGGMAGLHEKGLVQPIKDFASSGKPLLGICLGMQMLMEESEEFGLHEGLGVIPGRVIGIPKIAYKGDAKAKIPHIGWNQLQEVNSWNDSIMRDINPGDSAYFVHSYMAVTSNEEHLLASTTYNGHRIAATIRKDNIYGCQFHPEKSGQIGLTIIRNFGS